MYNYHVSSTKEGKLNLDQNSCLSPNRKNSPAPSLTQSQSPCSWKGPASSLPFLSAFPLFCLILLLLWGRAVERGFLTQFELLIVLCRSQMA